MNNEIKAVIFDLDDTIFATCSCSFERHSVVAKKLNLPLPSREKFYKDWGLPWKNHVKILWPEVDFEFYQSHYWKHFGKTILPLHKGAKRAISLLSKKYFLAIVTSRDRKSIFKRMKQAGIDSKIFECIVSADDSEVHKPNPKVFDKALRVLGKKGISKNEIIYVGDLLYDFQAAKNAGILFVAVLTGLHKAEDFEKNGLDKKFILDSIRDLHGFLKKPLF